MTSRAPGSDRYGFSNLRSTRSPPTPGDNAPITPAPTPSLQKSHTHRQRIERLKHGAFIINTGRGSLLDTEALVPALESGRLGGAALDVLEGEEGVFYADCRNKPIESKQLLRLQKLANVIISPHTAYYTDHAPMALS